MAPMTPADVRRRGDRRRRRTTAALAAGAALVVVAVATPLVVLGQGGADRVAPAEAPLSAEVDLLGPDDVTPLTDLEPWAEAPAEDPTLTCQQEPLDSLGADELVRSQLEADFVLPAGASPDPDAPDVAGGRLRQAVLQLPDEDAAGRAYETVTGWVADCDEAAGSEQDDEVRELAVDGGRAEWRTRTTPSAEEVCGDVDCDSIRFDRMGVAQVGDRLVVFSLAQLGGPLEPEGLDQAMEAAFAAAVDKARPDVDAAPVPSPAPGPDTTIPEGFPLDQGLVADPDLGEKTGPSADATGVVLPEGGCGADVWPGPDVVERLATTVSGPEYLEARELVTFATTAEAASVHSRLVAAVVDCPELAGDTAADDLAFRLVPDDTDVPSTTSTTFSAFYAEGVANNSVFRFDQVGNTILAAVVVGDMSASSAAGSALALSRGSAPLVAELCTLTGAC